MAITAHRAGDPSRGHRECGRLFGHLEVVVEVWVGGVQMAVQIDECARHLGGTDGKRICCQVPQIGETVEIAHLHEQLAESVHAVAEVVLTDFGSLQEQLLDLGQSEYLDREWAVQVVGEVKEPLLLLARSGPWAS